MQNGVGVLGGMGPMATNYFMKLVIELTKATCDQDHIDMIILNHATISDRTNFIIGKSLDNPSLALISDAKTLESLGVSFIVIPCNTAHFFYDDIQKNVNVEVVNMLDCVLDEIDKNKAKVGIMATRGTIESGLYQEKALERGYEVFLPNEYYQNRIMSFIYDNVKKGKPVSFEEFEEVLTYFYTNGCDFIVIGCTELSVIVNDLGIEDRKLLDSLDILAKTVVLKKGKSLNL